MKEKISLKTKFIIFILIFLIIVLVFVVRPFIEFKKLEKVLYESGSRYYEVNTTKLPTGKRIKKVYLKELYDKDYISSDYKEKYTNNKCNVENSFVRVTKNNEEYNYETYLDCGFWKSKIDHEGPVIKLKGKDDIKVYRNEKYKEPGIESVVDDTDGAININKVTIDQSKVNTSKVGVYEVTYKITDSYNNTTIKKRTIRVVETLNHIVTSQTSNKKTYTGNPQKNYLQIDGILFRIVGSNDDNTVKIVTDNPISAVSYKNVYEFLNNDFYNKLSDSAKSLIYKKSKWCIDNVADPNKIDKCSKYSKKYPIGLLSIYDINNAKNSDNETYLTNGTLLSNLKDNNTAYTYYNNSFNENSISDNVIVSPTLNIINNAEIVSGDGSSTNPLRIKGNTGYLKSGSKINEAKVGDYISYSGYDWRVIEKEDNETTKIIMNGVVKQSNSEQYNISFTNSSNINFNTSKKENIGYNLTNNVSKYVSSSLLVNTKTDYVKYTKNIGYKEKNKSNINKIKFNLPSMYDIFSTSIKKEYWYKEYSNYENCYMYYQGITKCSEKVNNEEKGIRVVAYLKKDATVILGKGTAVEPYTIK